MLQSKNTYQKVLIVSLGILLVLILVLLFTKNIIFQQKLKKKIESLEEKHHIEIQYDLVKLKGLSRFSLDDLYIHKKSDTLLFVNSVGIELNLRSLLKAQIKPKTISFDCAEIFVKNSVSDTLIHSDEKISKSSLQLHHSLIQLMDRLNHYLPNAVIFNSLKIESDYFPHGQIELFAFDMHNQTIETELKYFYQQDTLINHIGCKLSSSRRDFTMDVYSEDAIHLEIPFLNQAELFLEKLSFNVSLTKIKRDKLKVIMALDQTEASINYSRLNQEPVVFDAFAFNQEIMISNNLLESLSSKIQLNKIEIHPFFMLDLDPLTLKLELNEKKVDVHQFIQSLPENCFTCLNHVQASGNFDYHFLFILPWNTPDSLQLESEVKTMDFRIQDFGQLDFTGLTDNFEHRPINTLHDSFTILIDPQNPHFKTLDEISPLLKAAVLYSEDGLFYYHKGFLLDAIKEALIDDIKERAFVRGGSTISQQLVKNLYLDNKKVVSRKLEEIIITWLLENYGQVSKDRLFEIYLNIIEWGPGTYGASQASWFYFNKDVKELSLSESIFMAAIIPRPKKFQYAFNKEGKLHDYFASHYQVVGQRMIKHEIINQEQFDQLIPNVELKGLAKNKLKVIQLQEIDSIM